MMLRAHVSRHDDRHAMGCVGSGSPLRRGRMFITRKILEKLVQMLTLGWYAHPKGIVAGPVMCGEFQRDLGNGIPRA